MSNLQSKSALRWHNLYWLALRKVRTLGLLTIIRKAANRLRQRLIMPTVVMAAKVAFQLRNRIWKDAPVSIHIAGINFVLYPAGSEAFFLWSRIRIESAELGFAIDNLAPGAIFCDIVGNAGVFTLLASAKLRMHGGGGRIFTFEPTPWTHELLQRNLALNDVQDVTVVHAALGKEVGTATLYVNATGSEGLNSLARPIRRDAHVVEEVTVPVMPLDAVLRQHGVDHVDLIKIDVEGAELLVFQGASEILAADDAPVILFECYPDNAVPFGYHPAEILWLLEGHGYEIALLLDDGSLCPRSAGTYHGSMVAAKPVQMREIVKRKRR